jgi:hypothetical protein
VSGKGSKKMVGELNLAGHEIQKPFLMNIINLHIQAEKSQSQPLNTEGLPGSCNI